MIIIRGELYSNKNGGTMFKNRRTGKMFPSKSKMARKAAGSIYVQLLAQKDHWDVQRKRMLVGHPLRVGFHIWRKTHRRFDYTNIIQQVADLMVKAGYIPDDSADYFIPVFFPYLVDKDNPRTIITLEKQDIGQ